MLKNLDQTWKDSLANNPFTEVRVYIGPRGAEYPPVTGTPVFSPVGNENVSGGFYLSSGELSYLVGLTNPMTIHFRAKVGASLQFREAFSAPGNIFSAVVNPATLEVAHAGNTRSGAIFTTPQSFADYTIVYNGASSLLFQNGNQVASGTLGALTVAKPVMVANGIFDYIRVIPNYAATAADIQNGFRTVYHEEVYFPFNKSAVGYARCNITRPEVVKGYTIDRQTGYMSANASVNLLDTDGKFASDQYAPYAPEFGSYNGTIAQRYLTRKMPMWIELYFPNLGANTGTLFPSLTLYPAETLYPQGIVGDTGSNTFPETLFFGMIPQGSFLRATQWGGAGTLSVSAQDGIEEMARRVIRKTRFWEDYYLSRSVDSGNSLFHELAKIATERELFNYAVDSSFEGTTANYWSSGTATATRPFFGTKSLPMTGTFITSQYCVLDVTKNERFTFGGWFYSASAVSFNLSITERKATTEYDFTSVAISHPGTGWFYASVSHDIVDSSTDNLIYRIFGSFGAVTVYADAIMLVYGDIKPWYVNNNTQTTGAATNASNAARGVYSWIGIDADAVDYIHPWAVMIEGENVWNKLKELSDACIVRYMILTEDGVLKMRSNFTTGDPAVLGNIGNVNGLATSTFSPAANKIKAQGCKITKRTYTECPWMAEASNLERDTIVIGSKYQRTIPPGGFLPSITESPDGYEARYGDTSDPTLPKSQGGR
jgi:hypothetical protein